MERSARPRHRRHPLRAVSASLALLLVTAALVIVPKGPKALALEQGQTIRISMRSDGMGPTHAGTCLPPCTLISGISSDGRFVAFNTPAALHSQDNDYEWDAYLRDVAAGTTVLVASPSTESSYIAGSGAITPDGNSIVYRTPAATFIWDRAAGTRTQILNIPTWGSISADGSRYAFTTSASLVAQDTNGVDDVYLKDLDTGAITLVSVSHTGGPADDFSGGASISPDGSKVAFDSQSNQIVGDDSNMCGTFTCKDVFVRDIAAQNTVRVSVDSAGNEANDVSDSARITSGSTVVFRSFASNLVSSDTNGAQDVFVHDMSSGETTRVSVSSTGGQGDGGSFGPTISADGQWIAFTSSATNLAPNDANSYTDVFIHDRETGETALASVASNGWSPSDGLSRAPAISGDGSTVSFQSNSETIITHDIGWPPYPDVFAYGIRTNNVTAATTGQTLGSCGGGVHAVNPSDCLSDPVNTATGNFHTSETDIALPGPGVPFEFTRSYNSLSSASGPLGPGWTHPYNASLEIDQSGDVTLSGETGQRVEYALQPDGSFAGGPGARSVLSAVSGGYELTRQDQVTYSFDQQGRLTDMVDRNGQGLALTYANGVLASVTDGGGRVITLSHEAGLLTGISLPDGRSVTYGYTGGLLTSVTDPRGEITTYTYDANGLLKKVVDPNGHTVVENTYQGGRVTQQVDPVGNLSTFSWNPTTETATMTDARGNVWTDVYRSNVLIRRIDPLGGETRFAHDDDLNSEEVRDANGNVSFMVHDDNGNLLVKRGPSPLSYVETWNYNARNDVTSYTDGRGNATTYDYDGDGNLIRETRPGGVVTEYGRDPATGLLTSVTDPRGKTTTYAYDSAGNLVHITSPLGHVTSMDYDASGRMTSIVEPRGNEPGATPADFTTTFTYDAGDNLLTQTDPLGNVTSFTYEAAGNRETRTDAKGRTTTWTNNAADELSSVIAPDQSSTSYAYDESGNLVSRTDANGHVTSYGYDAANRLLTVTSPIGQVWTYEHDDVGNLTSVVTPQGNETPDPSDGRISYTYDALNRLIGIDYSDATPDVSFAYDAASNRTQMTDGAGTETYSYDALDRRTAVTRGSDTFSYQFDPAGNVTRRTYPDGTVVDHAYDDEGRLASVSSDGNVVTYSYDAAGNLTSTTLPAGNGHVESRTYDRAGRLTEMRNAKGSNVLSRFTYSLDEVGNPTSVETESGVTTYAYDALDRLTEACFAQSCPGPSDPFIRYAYDAVGNRLTEDRPAGTATYTYNAADQLVSRTGLGGSVTYTYDPNGNQAGRGPDSSSYDLSNRMVSASVGSTTIEYSFDGDGKRLLASAGTQSAKKTKYLWDPSFPLPQLAIERDGANKLLRRYVHGGDLVSMTTGGKDYFYHYDAIGSTSNLTSSTGALQWTYEYEPFGTLRSEIKSDNKAPTNLMRFTGEVSDTGTSLYHLRARQYDPTQGRLLSLDPLPSALQDSYVSAYLYVNNRPTVLVDPSGLRGSSPGGPNPTPQPPPPPFNPIDAPDCKILTAVGSGSAIVDVISFFFPVSWWIRGTLTVFAVMSNLASYKSGCWG